MIRVPHILTLTLILTLRLCILPCQAAVHYVATNGNDSTGNGTVSKPWRTIQKGVTSMSGGDTLYIRGGEYIEARIGDNKIKSGPSPALRTTIAGYPGEVAKYFPNSSGNVIYQNNGSSNIVLRDFWIDSILKANHTGHDRQLMMRAPVNILITNMVFTNSPRSGPINIDPWSPLDFSKPASNVVIEASTFARYGWNNPADATYGSMGVYYKSIVNSVIRSNTFFKYTNARSSAGIQMTRCATNILIEGNVMRDGWSGIILYSDSSSDPGLNNVAIRNNVIVGMSKNGLQMSHQMKDVYIDNNTIFNAGRGIHVSGRAKTSLVIRNNILWSPSTMPWVYEEGATPGTRFYTNNLASHNGTLLSGAASTGNLIGKEFDPRFVSKVDDFHLLPASPARNAGVDLSSLFVHDHKGLLRGRAGGWDLGAFQHLGQVIISLQAEAGQVEAPMVLHTEALTLQTVASSLYRTRGQR